MDEKAVNNNDIQEDINTPKEDTFLIIEYFKGNQTLLIACISAMVAIFSFVTSLIAYVFQCISAQAWNIPIDIITTSHSGKFYYYVIASVIYYLFTIISIELFAKLYEKCNDLIIASLYSSSSVKFNKKCIKEHRKEIRNLRKTLNSNNKKINKSINKKISIIKEKINENKNLMTQTNNARRELNKMLYFILIVGHMIIALILFPLWIFFYIFNSKVTFVTILAWVCSVLIFKKIGYRQAMDRMGDKGVEVIKRTIKKTHKFIDEESLKEYTNKLEVINNKKNKNINYRKYLSDRNIHAYVLAMVVVIVIISIYTIITGTSNAKHQKDFYVIELDKEIYAVVFQTEKLNVLEKIEITGNNAVIDTSFQKYLPYENLSLQKMKFEKVEIK